MIQTVRGPTTPVSLPGSRATIIKSPQRQQGKTALLALHCYPRVSSQGATIFCGLPLWGLMRRWHALRYSEGRGQHCKGRHALRSHSCLLAPGMMKNGAAEFGPSVFANGRGDRRVRGRGTLVFANPFRSLARTSTRTRDCCPQRLGSTRSRMLRSSTSPGGVPLFGGAPWTPSLLR